MAEAVATSGGAIVFAGGTVIVALLALAVAQIPFVTS
ncbi:MAG: MMPL family transporter, partial [Actinobacteria bacterium]|nr:MMPL family transporter [Actinomycetota bacterium]